MNLTQRTKLINSDFSKSLVGSAPTCSAIALRVTQVLAILLFYCNKGKKMPKKSIKKKKRKDNHSKPEKLVHRCKCKGANGRFFSLPQAMVSVRITESILIPTCSWRSCECEGRSWSPALINQCAEVKWNTAPV